MVRSTRWFIQRISLSWKKLCITRKTKKHSTLDIQANTSWGERCLIGMVIGVQIPNLRRWPWMSFGQFHLGKWPSFLLMSNFLSSWESKGSTPRINATFFLLFFSQGDIAPWSFIWIEQNWIKTSKMSNFYQWIDRTSFFCERRGGPMLLLLGFSKKKRLTAPNERKWWRWLHPVQKRLFLLSRWFFWYVLFWPGRTKLGGGFKYVLFSPLPGEMIQFDEHIFQIGWNHQPAKNTRQVLDLWNSLLKDIWYSNDTCSFFRCRYCKCTPIPMFQFVQNSNPLWDHMKYVYMLY